ncbi:MAG: hypothetical protein A2428_16900 [Bdellovibrionales bacterium RIFOXYC1_FULL_54_43]|nr:MAG: hypothetical protein A2428_16900 [Bdellovibrionales bacterium RIFOXYC1_FULL_54_43]OFZ80582.1 MAG: hypothetical protein A2603_15580 [Bdellovibrionales bacterium RIFOXYD1_FULL_55_31]
MKGILVLAFLAIPSLAFAKASDVKILKDATGDSTVSCKTCHPAGKNKELTEFGKKYQKVRDEKGDLSKLK